MGKVNAKGRNKYEAHIRLHRGVTNSAAWKTLSCEAKALLIEIWTRHNGSNNGRIPFSYREARKTLSAGRKRPVHFRKVVAAFGALEETGFLIAREKGSFDWKVGAGEGRATEWEVATEPCDGQPAKKLYRTWTKKQNPDAAVEAAGFHSGRRKGKSTQKPHPNDLHSGSRSARLVGCNGVRSGSTLNIPEGTPSLIQPSLATLQARGFTPDVALARLTESAWAAP